MKNIIIIISIILMFSCGHVPLEQDKHIRLIVLVNVVDDLEMDPVKGLAYRNGEIIVEGVETKDGILVDYYILGHELAHLLHWADSDFKDPDK